MEQESPSAIRTYFGFKPDRDRKPVNQEHQLLRVRYPCNNNYYNVVGRHVRTCILELLVQNYWYT